MKKVGLLFVLLLVSVMFAAVASAKNTGKGVCASCHVKMPEMDVRLVVEAMKQKGHPDLEKLGKDWKLGEWTVNECLTCHASSNSRIAFKRVLHKIHLTSKYFTPKYNGSCLTCHVLLKNGEIGIRDTLPGSEVRVPAETLKAAPFLGKK